MKQILKIKEVWKSMFSVTHATESEILIFEHKNNLHVPDDSSLFFKSLNGTNGEYDEKYFHFYSLDEFKKIEDEFKDWSGVAPNYGNLTSTFKDHKTCFVFANHQSYLFSYCIRLYQNESDENEIYILCGDEFKVIANSFAEFLDLYIGNSEKLQFA